MIREISVEFDEDSYLDLSEFLKNLNKVIQTLKKDDYNNFQLRLILNYDDCNYDGEPIPELCVSGIK